MTNLANIRSKVRRLTASPSPNQITDETIDEYINTFYLNDLPSHLKLFDLKETYIFFTEPNVDIYTLNVNPNIDPSAATAGAAAYYSIEPPVYVDGYEASYTQSHTEFYRWYPAIANEDTEAGDGGAGAYAITITNTPVLRNHVTVSADAGGGTQLVAYDDGAGGFTGDVSAGAIDYETGAITGLTFSLAVPTSSTIYVRSVPYVASRPISVLFYNNVFTVRPVPDKTYRVEIDAYIYPTEFLSATPTGNADPQYIWQLLAIGAAKKIFEDRGSIEEVQKIMPLFQEQMLLCSRKTLEQNRPVRAATIYSSNATGSGNLNYRGY